MRAVLILPLMALLPAGLLALAPSPSALLETSSTAELEQRVKAIDEALSGLSRISLRSGSGSLGYRSHDHPDSAHEEWVQIELPQDSALDQIVLVPSVWRNPIGGFNADGFPETFTVIAGRKGEETGTVIASFSPADGILPRIAPLIIPCNITAAWVRVECDTLPPRLFDGRYNLQLSEIFIFSGATNVALHQPVTHSGEPKVTGLTLRPEYMVDGFTPYFMNTGQGRSSRPFNATAHGQLSIHLDLGAEYVIDGFHLHAVELNDTAPQGLPSSYGFPRRFYLEAANKADFSDAVRLYTYQRASFAHAGPILMRHLPETACRYVRIQVIEPFVLERENMTPAIRTGFAELEILAKGQNVALHRPIRLENPGDVRHPATSLTDGRNLYGRILSPRQWMNELVRRHDLERERPLLTAELNQRYARQQINLRRLGWLAALLTGGIFCIILVDRMLRMRHIARIKERFAADLHDELGANLHTISLIGELAEKKAVTNPERLPGLLQQIQATTKRSIVAVHHVSDLQTATGLYKGLIADMNRAAERIVVDLKHKLSVSGEQHLATIDQQKQVDLFLFYKECLINCCRHSDATELSTRLVVGAKTTLLTVTDNGSSPPDHGAQALPPSLKRRAKILGARVTLTHPDEGGWCISLRLRNKRRWPRLTRAGK